MRERKVLIWGMNGFLLMLSSYFIYIAVQYEQESVDAVKMLAGILLGGLFINTYSRWNIFVRGFLNIFLGIGITLFCICEIYAFRGAEANNIDCSKVDYILVLGNKLQNNKMSFIMEMRIDKVVELSKALESTIIVSGGKQSGNSVSEAEVMKECLLSRGVNNLILLENKSQNTRQNFTYTAELVEKESSIIIVTSDFHAFRAETLAYAAGFSNVQCICSKTKNDMVIYYKLREVVAIINELIKFAWDSF